tara:strand:+ start:172 stop:354 length:183 start_codon:yes stop_codon:yes gene_type:complete
MYSESKNNPIKSSSPVSKKELNSWRRGFTYQAEIWNGRMAIAGLLLLALTFIGSNLFFGN